MVEVAVSPESGEDGAEAGLPPMWHDDRMKVSSRRFLDESSMPAFLQAARFSSKTSAVTAITGMQGFFGGLELRWRMHHASPAGRPSLACGGP